MIRNFCVFAFLLCGCASQTTLSVFTEYVSVETLPSYQIGTPDPRLYCPDIGERLHIKWSLSPECHYGDVALHLIVIFGNREEQDVWMTLNEPVGTYVYSLMNEEYWEQKGIFTYKIELYGDGELIKEWLHQLYVERIHIGEE